MNQKKVWNNCKLFSGYDCPRKEDELMKDFIRDVDTVEAKAPNHYKGRKLNLSKEEEVNKLFCNTCDSFKNRRS